jgi:UDPglucose 6-dehydrogenase
LPNAYRFDQHELCACFADFGHQVTCVDKDEDKLTALRRGDIAIFEPGLDAPATNAKARRLNFTTDLTVLASRP